MSDDSFDGGTHQVKGVIHIGHVVDLRFADDDSQTLSPGPQLFDAGGTFSEERGKGGPLLAKHLHGSGSTIGNRGQLCDGVPDRRELLLWCQCLQFCHRKPDATQRFVEGVPGIRLADVHSQLLNGNAELLGVHAGHLGCKRVALKGLHANARAGTQIV